MRIWLRLQWPPEHGAWEEHDVALTHLPLHSIWFLGHTH